MQLTSVYCFMTILTAAEAPAQWLNYPVAGLARGPDGQPDLSAPVPRAPDGKPDLSGIGFRPT